MSEPATSTSPRPRESDGTDYGQRYFRDGCGVPYERGDYWLEFFGRMADAIVRDLRPTTVLDAGCAMGFLVEALRERGVEAWGIDISEYAIERVDPAVREHCEVASLTEPLPRRYDLIVSVEVLEHLEPAETGAALANLCAASDRLLLSTTPDDFAQATHRNVRSPEAWAAALAGEGFLREVEHDVSYVTPWASLYSRREEPLEETVRRYDRSWSRQRLEVGQLREALGAAQERLAELEDQSAERRPELDVELERRQAEILRLRDLLIGMDAELGHAKGKVAEYEDREKRLSNAKKRLETKSPLLGKLVDMALRLLRRAPG